ncbi:DoxX family membrane protein [Humisphaera borealis]|uniref:DoxX family membrane protein n=1 Tax=Humisphaera borealis TaxID=2807512 RepID=A0A7M2WU03_9BACT|nr:DoxX family membrane protein [Humisphaera borealis]QOV88933.1 DoxX family membrane protein [Humisphaera borealis]
MANPFRSDLSNGLGLLAARLPLGVAFVLSGVAKFRMPGGVSAYVTENLSSVPQYVPTHAAEKFLMVVPYAHLGLGILLLAGLLSRVSAFGAALLSVAFGLILGFVDTNPTPSMDSITEPTKYLCFALVTFFAGPGMFSVDRLLFGKPDRSID